VIVALAAHAARTSARIQADNDDSRQTDGPACKLISSLSAADTTAAHVVVAAAAAENLNRSHVII